MTNLFMLNDQTSKHESPKDSESVSGHIIEFDIMAHPSVDEPRIVKESCTKKPKSKKRSKSKSSVPFFEDFKEKFKFLACNTEFCECFNIMHALSDHFHHSTCLLHVSTWYVDSVCSRHMTGTQELLSSYVNKEGSSVAFGGNQKGRIKGYGMIKEICLVSSMKNEEAWLWHTRFCHLNFHTLDKLVRLKLVKGLPNIKFDKDHLCSACEMGKLKRSSHKTKFDPPYDKRLQMLHVDLCGPIVMQSVGGKKYILVEFIRKKFQVPLLLINLLKRLQVRVLRSDNALSSRTLLPNLCWHNTQFSAPRTPQQNGVVERKNRTIVEAARTMLNASGRSCLHCLLHIEQILGGETPNIKFFHVFGCKCYVLNDREPIGNFDPKGDDAIFIGYAWDSVIQDKFIEELKIQAETSPNSTITEDLERLFNDWYEDFEDLNRASIEAARAF
ncbi:hypothetical protein OSB04_019818 [Centaurea solstitialis]|uniref:GAG-pre-integrase domain-containing protein n=1 Tax=Centaurea solstitialis TaxID=347529 RepID=A0AA38SR19_9ASTR|nr:hypothetical protein OSB04_019818 [Centaurea solstitialis]